MWNPPPPTPTTNQLPNGSEHWAQLARDWMMQQNYQHPPPPPPPPNYSDPMNYPPNNYRGPNHFYESHERRSDYSNHPPVHSYSSDQFQQHMNVSHFHAKPAQPPHPPPQFHTPSLMGIPPPPSAMVEQTAYRPSHPPTRTLPPAPLHQSYPPPSQMSPMHNAGGLPHHAIGFPNSSYLSRVPESFQSSALPGTSYPTGGSVVSPVLPPHPPATYGTYTPSKYTDLVPTTHSDRPDHKVADHALVYDHAHGHGHGVPVFTSAQTIPNVPVTNFNQSHSSVMSHHEAFLNNLSGKEDHSHHHPSGSANNRKLPSWLRDELEKMEAKKRQELTDVSSITVTGTDLDQVMKDEEGDVVMDDVHKTPRRFDEDEDEDSKVPSPGSSRSASPIRLTEEERAEEEMYCIRTQLTEILLEVTNDIISQIAQESITGGKNTVSRTSRFSSSGAVLSPTSEGSQVDIVNPSTEASGLLSGLVAYDSDVDTSSADSEEEVASANIRQGPADEKETGAVISEKKTDHTSNTSKHSHDLEKRKEKSTDKKSSRQKERHSSRHSRDSHSSSRPVKSKHRRQSRDLSHKKKRRSSKSTGESSPSSHEKYHKRDRQKTDRGYSRGNDIKSKKYKRSRSRSRSSRGRRQSRDSQDRRRHGRHKQ